jgi:hypothetical protein
VVAEQREGLASTVAALEPVAALLGASLTASRNPHAGPLIAHCARVTKAKDRLRHLGREGIAGFSGADDRKRAAPPVSFVTDERVAEIARRDDRVAADRALPEEPKAAPDGTDATGAGGGVRARHSRALRLDATHPDAAQRQRAGPADGRRVRAARVAETLLRRAGMAAATGWPIDDTVTAQSALAIAVAQARGLVVVRARRDGAEREEHDGRAERDRRVRIRDELAGRNARLLDTVARRARGAGPLVPHGARLGEDGLALGRRLEEEPDVERGALGRARAERLRRRPAGGEGLRRRRLNVDLAVRRAQRLFGFPPAVDDQENDDRDADEKGRPMRRPRTHSGSCHVNEASAGG